MSENISSALEHFLLWHPGVYGYKTDFSSKCSKLKCEDPVFFNLIQSVKVIMLSRNVLSLIKFGLKIHLLIYLFPF